MKTYHLFCSKTPPRDGMVPVEDFIFSHRFTADHMKEALQYALQFPEVHNAGYVSINLVEPGL